jgi:nucleotide-binding universal stress UspA family protein
VGCEPATGKRDPWTADSIVKAASQDQTEQHARNTPRRTAAACQSDRPGHPRATGLAAAYRRRDERVVVSGERPAGHVDVGRRAIASQLTMPGAALRTVVVGYDGSPPSQRSLERAATLVGASGRPIVVTASPSSVSQGLVSEPLLDGPTPDEQSVLLQRSRALLQERGIESTLVASGSDPAEALIHVARDHSADLIVVGHTGAGYVTRALLGSTAENVLRHAPCDVLVVR